MTALLPWQSADEHPRIQRRTEQEARIGDRCDAARRKIGAVIEVNLAQAPFREWIRRDAQNLGWRTNRGIVPVLQHGDQIWVGSHPDTSVFGYVQVLWCRVHLYVLDRREITSRG